MRTYTTAIALLVSLLFLVSTANAQTNFEGLREIKSQTWDRVEVRPNMVFTVYTGIMLGDVRIAYRTPDRSQLQFPFTDEQKAQFQQTLERAYTSELVTMRNAELVNAPGRDILLLSVRAINVTATVPPRSVGDVGRASIALQAIGEVTLVLELFDSRSGEILARAVDTQTVVGAAIAEGGDMITNWEGAGRLSATWASTTRSRLDKLLGSL
jgi:hypothetical protein